MNEKISLAYGNDKISFLVPQESMSGSVIKPREADSLSGDPKEIILSALQKPFKSPLLKEIVNGKITALVSSDEFRSGLQKKILEALIPEIISYDPKKLKVFFATGSHSEEIYAKNLKEHAHNLLKGSKIDFEIIANNCYDENNFIKIGDTSAGTPLNINKAFLACETRIYAHEAKYHYMNGYSCIDKQVLPGLASKKTIEVNHKNSLDHNNSMAGRNPWHKDKKRQFNPFSVDIKEAREISEELLIDEKGNLKKQKILAFGVDMVSEKNNIYWIKAGNPDRVTEEMTEEVDKLSLFEVKKEKYVVISPGSSPVSDTLYSTQNCFDMALKGAIKDGGEALVIAPCAGREDVSKGIRGLAPDENSKKLFYDNLVKMKNKCLEECSCFVDVNFELYLWKTDRVLKLLKENKVNIYLYSKLNPEKVSDIGFIPVPNVQEWIDERVNRNDGKFHIIDNGNKILVKG